MNLEFTHLAKMMEEMQQPRFLKKIKVTLSFYYCLMAYFTNKIICEKDDSLRGYHERFTDIPIEIDNEIDGPYELVY